jgi:hypothetical protein
MSKMPPKLDSGLLDHRVGDWLNILHLDRRQEASLREEETVLSLMGKMFSEDLAEDLFMTTLDSLGGWRSIMSGGERFFTRHESSSGRFLYKPCPLRTAVPRPFLYRSPLEGQRQRTYQSNIFGWKILTAE